MALTAYNFSRISFLHRFLQAISISKENGWTAQGLVISCFYTRFGIAILIALRLNNVANIIVRSDNTTPVKDVIVIAKVIAPFMSIVLLLSYFLLSL